MNNAALIAKLEKRHAELEAWLRENAPEIDEHEHLDKDTPERAYWHFGYYMAVKDILRLLKSHD